jgi:glycosyltransferase involved in cell wall biosynthesis
MNDKLNILKICSWYPNDNNPTLGNFVQKHAESISIYNNVVVLAIFSDVQIKNHRITIHERPNLTEIIVYYPKRTKGIKFVNLILNFAAHTKAFRIGFQKVKEKFVRPDIVHLNITYPLGIWALWLKIKHNIPYVITENATGLHVGTKHAYPKHILRLCQKIIGSANLLIPVSRDLKDYMKKLSPNSEFEIISNVVDEKIFNYEPSKTNELKKSLIHISTCLDVHKNIRGILNSIHSISKFRQDFILNIVSDGDVQYAKEIVVKYGLEHLVLFHSTKTTLEIATMLKSSSALLLFSNYENFPCVIAESLMLGKPVISTSVNGIPEHVNSSNGILVKPGDEKELETVICNFLDNKIQFDSNSIHSYAFEYFSYQEVGRKFDVQYRRVLSNNK